MTAPSPEPTAAYTPDVTVVGAGLAGALMTLFLARRGLTVDVYERRDDPRGAFAVGGRSINLALSHRGIRALAAVGLDQEVLARSIPMRGRRIHARDGSLSFQPYGTDDEHVIHAIDRAALNRLLVETAEPLPGVRFFFGHRVADVDVDAPSLRFVTPRGERVEVPAKAVIGADGAYSAVRARLVRTPGFDYAQSYLTHGYKELRIPPGDGGAFRIEKHALHIWPRRDFMLIALPNLDGSFTCTLFMPLEGGPDSFAGLADDASVRGFFERWFPDSIAHLPDLLDAFRDNPTGSLVTIRCAPWNIGRVLLIGDAGHAVVPFYGQGMNASFEDCRLLDEALGAAGAAQGGAAPIDWAAAFAGFAASRKEDADALADLAVANYHEMRASTASPVFLLVKRFEKHLERWLGDRFLSLYTMVTHTSIPYAEARRREARQRRAMWVGGALLALAVVGLVSALVSG